MNDRTLNRLLLSAAETIRQQIAAGFSVDAVARLTETAAVVIRVAQQIDRHGAQSPDARSEYEALSAAQAEFAALSAPSAVTAPQASIRAVDGGALQAFLRGHVLGGPDVSVTAVRLLSGGRCKITALVEQSGAVGLPSAFVLRQDWDAGATDTTVAGEFALLELLYERGLRVPRPLLVEKSGTALGSPFMLVEQVTGKVEGGLYNPPQSRELMLEMAGQLGRIHAIRLADVEPLLDHIPRQTASDPAEIQGFADLHARIGIQSRLVDMAIDWLKDNVALAGSDLTLIHNDFGFHNVLVDGNRLAAVLDWELARIGHPAADLGYIKHFVERVMPWDDFIASYVDAGGVSVSAATIRYHAIWNAIRLYGLIMQARHHLELGRVNDMEITYVCADNLLLLIAYLGRELFGADEGNR